MSPERITNQKRIILEYLKSVKTHPSAEMVYLAVKKKLPQISLGTVYRVLNNLKEKGEIIEIPYGIRRYDGDTSSHGHFFCEKCGKIFDVFENLVISSPKDRQNLLTKISRKFGRVKNYQVYLYGQCKNCQRK